MSDPIENVERETMSQLYDDIEVLTKGLKAADAACQKLEADNERLRAALQFYANVNSYPDERLHQLTAVAKAALKGVDDER